mgnify:FL=1|jgi:dTDP-glucose 4,6-dehydratase|tara:strand:+ start:975 stop:2063 length:1089 start_codon:yes stop_codon:yes gene_type:complete
MDNKPLKFLITGGAGFIGSAVIRYIIDNTSHSVLNVDKLTYAGNLESLQSISNSPRYSFNQIDICETEAILALFHSFQPTHVLHLAAESHVDRSIDSPEDFITTNIIGTYSLLEAFRLYWSSLTDLLSIKPIFHHISTDEVFGDLGSLDEFFTENTPYSPSSPYSASKAASDHLVRAWGKTYGIPILISNCSNNYGPYHFPEKLIPHIILNALQGKQLPVYGSGLQIRDWLYVDDHARALFAVATKGVAGETYNIGGDNEQTNLYVVESICNILEELAPQKPKNIKQYKDLIAFVQDRPGHDQRYAIDASKIKKDLGWSPQESFESGLQKTIQWFLENENWWKNILSGKYKMTRMGDITNKK